MKATLPRLIGYYWKNGSWSLWIQAALIVLLPFLFLGIEWRFDFARHHEISWELAKGLSLSSMFSFLCFPILFAMRFFSQTPGNDAFYAVPFGDAEFLLTRPVSRRKAWLASAGLFYGLVSLMILPNAIPAVLHPSIPVWFPETSPDIARYRDAFPDAAILSRGKASLTLLLPGNALYLLTIPCLFVLLVAIVAQGVCLIRWKDKRFRYLFVGFGLVPLLLPAYLQETQRGKAPSFDDIYLFFVRHCPSVVLGVLALFVLVQWLSLRKAASGDAV